MLFLLSSADVTPEPLQSAPFFLMQKTPHDGLFSVIMAVETSIRVIRRNAPCAPLRKQSVTSIPCEDITLALPSTTSHPSPPHISAGARGVGNPPSCSGHRGRSNFLKTGSERISWNRLLPSYLQLMPRRHALTAIILKIFQGRVVQRRDLLRNCIFYIHLTPYDLYPTLSI